MRSIDHVHCRLYVMLSVVLSTAYAWSGCGSTDAADDNASAQVMEPAKALTDNTAGKVCSSDKDCGNGTCKHELPGLNGDEARPAADGFCSFGCHINADCGAEGACIGAGSNGFSIQAADEKGLCLAPCDTERLCRDGYRCEDPYGYPLKEGMSVNGYIIGSCVPPSDEE